MSEPSHGAERLPLEDNGISESDRTQPSRTAGRRRLFLFPLLYLALFAGAVLGLYFQPPGLKFVFNTLGLEPGGGTDTPIAVAVNRVRDEEEVSVVSEGDVVALGRIIPKGDVVTVSPPYGSGDARVAEIKVSVGDFVGQDQVLAVMDSLPQLQAAAQTARAKLAVSEADLLKTREMIQASRAEAAASLARAEATEKAALSNLERATKLLERRVVTKASVDDAVARATEATRDVERARATLSRYTVNSGQVQADIAVAEASLESARAELAQAQQDLEKGYVRAPISGTVLDVNVRPGERPGSDGLLRLGDTSQMTVEAEVYQTMIGRITIGDPATVTTDALSSDLKGQVTAIGLELGRQSITSEDPAANTDARVVEVIITLDADSTKIAKRFTNLQVITRIDAGRREE